ncbi:MAG TPA: hypothetical protein VIR27_02900 [Mycobacteriales bacterium]
MADEQPRFARRRVRRDRPRRPGRAEYRSDGSLPGETPADNAEPHRRPTDQASTDQASTGQAPPARTVTERPRREGPAPSVPARPTPPRGSASVDTRPVRQQGSARRPHRDDRGERGERGLRGLVGSGPSQVGVSGALRARDAARPSEADLRAAEAELVVVRRHYVPPDQLPRATRSGPGRPDHSGSEVPEDS